MNKLWEDIEALKASKLSVEEVFYYASFIHLVFVCLHPYNDGNGRAGGYWKSGFWRITWERRRGMCSQKNIIMSM